MAKTTLIIETVEKYYNRQFSLCSLVFITGPIGGRPPTRGLYLVVYSVIIRVLLYR